MPLSAPGTHIPVLLNEVCHHIKTCVEEKKPDGSSATTEANVKGRKKRLLEKHKAGALHRGLLADRTELLCVDGTLGAGGHASVLLTMLPQLSYLGMDRDLHAIKIATETLASFIDVGRVNIVNKRFAEITSVLQEKNATSIGEGKQIQHPDIFLFDLGVSSMQLDQPERGFSFKAGPLDMRMGQKGETLLELIERSSAEDLADIIKTYGNERLSNPIGRAIKRQWADGELKDTSDIKGICNSVYRFTNNKLGKQVFSHKGKGGTELDPATRTMQALRIALNDELGELERVLAQLPFLCNPQGGSLALFISFHEAEDRLVKRTFKRWQTEGLVRLLTSKPAAASDEEIRANPRSRSAKLRACQFLTSLTSAAGEKRENGEGDKKEREGEGVIR
jgi:16S rRNA (cytosine1402-N4)-methyltransferase